jgi:hypothetical protein
MGEYGQYFYNSGVPAPNTVLYGIILLLLLIASRVYLGQWRRALAYWGAGLVATAALILVHRSSEGWTESLQRQLGVGMDYYRTMEFYRTSNLDRIVGLRCLAALLILPFCGELWRKWFTDRVRPDERRAGAAGLRAALRSIDLAWCAGIVAAFHWGDVIDARVALIVVLAIQLARPVWMTIAQPPPSIEPTAVSEEDLTREREKILDMLAEGKVTAEESAELLTALGDSSRGSSARPSQALPPARKMLLAGAALVLIGFFLPWFAIDVGREVSRTDRQDQDTVRDLRRDWPGAASTFPATIPTPGTYSLVLRVAGVDVAHGMGWLALLAALAAATLPLLGSQLDAPTRRTIAGLALAVGSIVLLDLLVSNLRFVSIGITLVFAGYLLAWIGLFKERASRIALDRIHRIHKIECKEP